jgi:hypothetical protein
MNERIKELFKEADFPKFDIENEAEKFAELIIKECMNIAYEYDAPKLSGPGMIIANRIESHFGVEE